MDNWNAHLFALQGRKCLAIVHKETFYSFVIFDFLKGQLPDFKQLFIDNLLRQLEKDKLLSKKFEKYLIEDFQNFELSTTDGDKSTIGYLNDCIIRLTWEREGRSPTIEEAKNYVEKYYNHNPLLSRKAITPIELMSERIKNSAQQSL